MNWLCTRTTRFACGAIFSIFLSSLQGCGMVVTAYANRASNDEGNAPRDLPDLAADRFLVDTAKEFALMALFAEVVYRRDLLAPYLPGNGCDYLLAGNSDKAVARFGMPHGKDRDKNRWQRWIPASVAPNVHPCVDVSGLYYETYVHLNEDGKIDEAVIAYRGTENRPGQTFDDWSANLVAALGFEPTEYRIAAENLAPLVEALDAAFDSDHIAGKIYAVGHSLGGGLAQQAGYLRKEITEVYTFNTSPVSNWSHLRLQQQVRNAWPIIHRVYHGGEFLEKARFVATSATPARFGRHDIGLQLQGRTNFGGHSMKIMTCNFAEILAKQARVDEVAHHYPLSYVRDGVLKQEVGEPALVAPCEKEPAENENPAA